MKALVKKDMTFHTKHFSIEVICQKSDVLCIYVNITGIPLLWAATNKCYCLQQRHVLVHRGLADS